MWVDEIMVVLVGGKVNIRKCENCDREFKNEFSRRMFEGRECTLEGEECPACGHLNSTRDKNV